MLAISCHTNLDCCKREVFPSWLPCRPMVGDRIYSEGGIELEVCEIAFNQPDFPVETILVELHMPSYCSKMTIAEFDERIKIIKAARLQK